VNRHEGNHGEDVKEITSTSIRRHALLHESISTKITGSVPYTQLVEETDGAKRSRSSNSRHWGIQHDRYLMVRGICQGRTPILIKIKLQTAGRRTASFGYCSTIWSQHLVLGTSQAARPGC